MTYTRSVVGCLLRKIFVAASSPKGTERAPGMCIEANSFLDRTSINSIGSWLTTNVSSAKQSIIFILTTSQARADSACWTFVLYGRGTRFSRERNIRVERRVAINPAQVPLTNGRNPPIFCELG